MTCQIVGPEKLANDLGLGECPESWSEDWESFAQWISSTDEALDWEFPVHASEVFDLPQECLDVLRGVYSAVQANQQVRLLADFWHYSIYHLPAGPGGVPHAWPVPEQLFGCGARTFSLAMMISGADHALANFAATGVSQEVVSDTLSYIGRYARDIKDRRGVWGLESIPWLTKYVRADIFRLGRLTFRASPYNWPFRVFRNRRDDKIIALCEPTHKYRRDGCADGSNGIIDPDAWTPVLELGVGEVIGCPATTQCTAQRTPVTLSMDEWVQILAPGDPRIEVHIAGGSRMDPDECAESYRQAVEFFSAYCPGVKYPVFTCCSWLLDPGLPTMLPAHSNIIRFQRTFHLLPLMGNARQAYDLVFGDPEADLSKVPLDTSLRRAIAAYVAAGNKMRSAGGIITWDEAARFACPR